MLEKCVEMVFAGKTHFSADFAGSQVLYYGEILRTICG